MGMNLGYAQPPGREKTALWPSYLCFLVLGVLVPFSRPDFKILTLGLSALAALIIGLLTVKLLIAIFNLGNPTLRVETAGQFSREAVGSGMLFMIPFTVLAALAQLLLNWNAVMPFASAAIMTAAATAGSEAMKKGAQGMKNVMVPSGLAFILSTGWMMLIGFLP
ncbi:MAG: hypothetical protein HPY50_10940 [Firmicutes bacterium]|nr:hypothetical protein [Bacillota bacterium]